MTLLNLFEQNEDSFRKELSNIRIPKDIKKLQDLMCNFLNNQIRIEDYKRELTMGELVMLNSAMELASFTTPIAQDCSQIIQQSDIDKYQGEGIWNAFFFNIAKFCLNRTDYNHEIESRINVDEYVNTLKGICEKIDKIVRDYRSGISNVKETYENVPKVTLATAYKSLLERMASLYVAIQSNALPNDVKSEFDKLYRTLKNHHYEIVGYTEETKCYYDETPSPNVTTNTVVEAAILENGELLRKGECLIPKN